MATGNPKVPGCLQGGNLHLSATHQDELYRQYIQRKMRIPAGLRAECHRVETRDELQDQLIGVQGETLSCPIPRIFLRLSFLPILAFPEDALWESFQPDGAFLMTESETDAVLRDLQALADGIRSHRLVEEDFEDLGVVSQINYCSRPCMSDDYFSHFVPVRSDASRRGRCSAQGSPPVSRPRGCHDSRRGRPVRR